MCRACLDFQFVSQVDVAILRRYSRTSAACEGLARQVQERVDMLAKYDDGMTRKKSQLLIMDRGEDMAAPLVHELSYALLLDGHPWTSIESTYRLRAGINALYMTFWKPNLRKTCTHTPSRMVRARCGQSDLF